MLDTDRIVQQISLVSRLGRVAATDFTRTAPPDSLRSHPDRLDLAQYNIDPTLDIVTIGGIRAVVPAVAGIAPSLVLGNEFPKIMVSAARFASYIGTSTVPVDPVATASAQLLSYGGNFGDLFRSGPGGGVPDPGLPANF